MKRLVLAVAFLAAIALGCGEEPPAPTPAPPTPTAGPTTPDTTTPPIAPPMEST